MEPWHIWLLAALGLAISEMSSGDFWLLCIGVGALGAAAVSVFPVGLAVQILAFAGGSLMSLGFLRPFLLKRLHAGREVRTGVDALPGKTGVITESVGQHSTGRLLVEGEDWRCVTVDGKALEKGSRVMVLQVDGSTLVVEKETEE
jgi:membrane protein implicated in regulation of membrane protease activity